jgi:hypothetical protein
MNDISSTIGLMRREFRDTHAVVSRVDHQLRRLIDGRASIDRPGGLTARAAVCALFSHTQRRGADDIAREHFRADRDLDRLLTQRATTSPASTSAVGWAAELISTVTADIADTLLPASAFVQLRALGIEYMLNGSALIRVPTWSPTATGAFVAEAAPIPVAAFVFGQIALGPKKCASIVAISDELIAALPVDVEQTMNTIVGESLALTIDGVLLDSGAVSATRPAGLLNGVTPLTATAGGGFTALLGDVKQLTAAIAPARRPVLIAGPVQAASLGLLAPSSALPVIIAPTLAAGTVIAVDAAAFASALGIPAFRASMNATLHMNDVPGALSAVGTPNVVAAPMRSNFQTDVTAMRTILPCDWTLRRIGAVAAINGATW